MKKDGGKPEAIRESGASMTSEMSLTLARTFFHVSKYLLESHKAKRSLETGSLEDPPIEHSH